MSMREAELHYYTYEEWLALDDSRPSELLNGRILMMSSPSILHQDIVLRLYDRIKTYLDGKPCRVYPLPIDVKLFEDEDTVLVPDLTVICDTSRLNDQTMNGAPDLVVEVLSPSSVRHDRIIKSREYLRAGVPEYWIVDPVHKTVELYTLSNAKYAQSVYTDEDTIESKVLPGLSFPLEPVFED